MSNQFHFRHLILMKNTFTAQNNFPKFYFKLKIGNIFIVINNPQFFSVSENSLTMSFGNEISEKINRKILDLSDYIEKNPFAGLIEIVPAFSSLTVFYDLPVVRKTFPEFPTAFEAVKFYLKKVVE